MDEDGCGKFETEEDKNICEHFLGNIFDRKQVLECNLYCSLRLIKRHGEIDVRKC